MHKPSIQSSWASAGPPSQYEPRSVHAAWANKKHAGRGPLPERKTAPHLPVRAGRYKQPRGAGNQRSAAAGPATWEQLLPSRRRTLPRPCTGSSGDPALPSQLAPPVSGRKHPDHRAPASPKLHFQPLRPLAPSLWSLPPPHRVHTPLGA
jgi:hypothetical protein